MALLAEERYPESGERILEVTMGSAVFVELVGPLMTQFALTRAQNANS